MVKRMIPRAWLMVLTLTFATGTAGCFSHYSGGPEFASVAPPSGYGLVHFYRPKSAIGAAQMIEVSQEGRVAILPSGGFATFVVAPGKQKLKSAINQWTTMIATTIPGVGFSSTDASPTATPIAIDIVAGQTYYIRTEFNGFKDPPSAEIVPADRGQSDIDGLHMAAGGRGRYPVLPFGTPLPAPPAN